MAASGGLNLPVGIELSQVEKDLQKLTSSVENVSAQLGKRLELKPTINTKAYEAAVDKMNDALMKLQTNFSKGFSYKVDNGKGFVDASFDSDSLFGSIDKMKASVAKLKGMLRNPGKYELNVGDAKELVGLQELIIKNWQTSTNEIHKQDAAVKSLIAKEVKLRNETKQRINDSIGRHERDRADAKNLNRRIDQIRAERVAIGKLIDDYEQLAAKQRKFGESDAGTNRRIAALRQEHAQYKNLKREELNRMKALNQNNSLFNDQGKLLGKLRTLASRYISIFTIGHLARKVAETTGFFERQQVALEGIVGSATKAAEIMGQIKSFAPNSPFQTKQLIEYTKQLAAYNIAVDDLFPKTKMLADLSAGLGVDMQRLILAYGQVNAASVLRGQELRQFTEAGIPMVQKLADKFSELNGRIVTTGEVFELISKRQVSFDMVSQVLTDMTSAGGKFYNMQANLMGTVYGQIEKLKDLWTLSLDAIGKSSHKTITRILSWMQAAVKNATSLLRGLTVTIALNTLGSIWSRLKQLRTEIGLMGMAAKGAWGAISLGAGVAIAVFKKLWDENHRIEKQFEEIHKSFEKQTRSAIKGLDEIRDKLHEADKGTKAYQEALDALSSNYSQYIGDVNTFVQSLSDEADAFGSLEIAIKKYNEALEKKQQLEQTRTTMGESFEMGGWTNDLKVFATPGNEHWNGIYGGFKDRYEMSYDDANAAFEEVMSNIFTEMRDKNLLSVSDDREVRNEENEKVFRELLPTFMKKGGLEKVFADFSQVGIDNLWSAFNSEAFLDNDSRRAYSEYRRLRREQLGEGTSDFAWISRIENTFEGLPERLKTELKAATPEQYSREYNAKWIEAALGYIGNKKGDFAQLGRKDENGNLIEQYAKTEYDALIAVMQRETKRDQNGNLIGFDEASVYNVENAFEEYRKALAAVDKESAGVLQHLMKIFSDGTDEASGRAAAVRETIFKIWANDAEGMKIARQYLPKDSDFSDIRGKLPQKKIDVLTKLGEYGITLDPNVPVKKYKERNRSTHSAEANADIYNLLKEYEVITRLMEATQKGITISVQGTDGKPLEAQLFDISSREKNVSKGGSKGDFTRFFADLFGMLKSAYNDQKKLIEGPEGVTNALIESIHGLSDDNILKGFYQDAANPFQKFLDKIADYDIETIFNAGDFKDVMNRFQTNVGVDNVSVADFENVWNQLLDVIRKKSVELRAAGRGKEASKVEAYLQTMTAEGLKLFGRDEIENKIDAAIRSLSAIEEATRMSSEQYEDMRAMMKTGNYQQIYELFNPGQQYKDRNEADVAKQTLASMLAPTTPGGQGMKSFIGDDIDKILKAEQLGISFIPELYNIINKIGNIGDELKDADGRVVDAKELQKVKDTFIKALKDLINGIKSETQKLSETRTRQEATTDKMYEAQQKYIDKINLLNKAHETGITETVNGEQKTIKIDDEQFTQRSTEALQEFTKSLSESLGGQFNTAIAQVTGDSGSATGSSGFGDFMQMMSSMQNGGLQSMIGTGLGQSAATGVEAGGMGMGAAAGAAGAAGGAIALIDMIIKAVYSSIKGMADIAKATLKVMKSFDDVSEVNIDEAGVMHIDTVYGGYNFAKSNAIIDTVQQYNQHVMDGWEKAKSGDVIGSIYEIYSSITDLITSIREIADMDLQKKIEKMQDCTDDLRNAATNLSAAAERLVGFDKVATKLEATGKSLSMAAMYEGMIKAEDAKKNSDGDKMQEWQQEYEQLMNDFYNGLYELRNEMVKSTEDWASQMGDAIRGAFQNGENAARAFRDTVKTMMGDVIEQMLQMAILEPLIESAIQNWTNSDYLQKKYTKEWTDDEGITHKDFDSDNYLKELLQNIGDPDKAENFYQSMLMIGDTLIDTVNGMPSVLQDFYKHNSELGTLSGGIESVTEDTARRIEALENSQLGEVFAIRTLLEQYLGNSGGFGDSTMASVQAAVVSIASDTSVISRIMQSFENQLNELRTGPSRPIHVTMV